MVRRRAPSARLILVSGALTLRSTGRAVTCLVPGGRLVGEQVTTNVRRHRVLAMTSTQRQWFEYAIAVFAIICSGVSLLALLATGATRWTTVLNALSLVLIVLAVKVRRAISDRGQ